MAKPRLTALVSTCALLALTGSRDATAAQGRPETLPNVIVVVTDDQGYGDFSCHGNPILKTPHLDRLHDQSVRFIDFHVSPMCTPTRSQIMTGRDCLANGAYVVCSGHGFIREGIPTLADAFASTMFSQGGYRTGLFGKWHLGDNYPYRPQDRGFQEVLTFRGWGLTGSQTYWNTSYYDDRYLHNGEPEQYHGYCTDVWFDEAMKWMKQCNQRHEPFFVYLPTSAPHGPLWVPEKYAAPYKGKVKPAVADFFGMIANIDENMGRLDAFLKDSGLYDNTILVFMTDNGGTVGVPVWNAGMRGKKTEYYDGGHRVPCFVRWPAGGLRQPADVDDLTECQDLLPTLIELCGLRKPEGVEFDGMSLATLLHGGAQPELASRKLVVQYGIWEEYRGPTKWNCAVMWGKWRLVRGTQLYDIKADPAQQRNLADERSEVVAALRDHYEKWWARTEPLARTFHPIHLGSTRENPVYLGSQDWVDSNTSNVDWIREGIQRNGPWHVLVEREGEYEISLRRWPAEANAAIAAGVPPFQGVLGGFAAGKALPITKARLRIADIDQSRPVTESDKAATFQVRLPAGPTELQTWFYGQDGEELCGAYYVYVTRIAHASNAAPPLYAFCVEDGVPGLKPRSIARQAKLFRNLGFQGAAYPRYGLTASSATISGSLTKPRWLLSGFEPRSLTSLSRAATIERRTGLCDRPRQSFFRMREVLTCIAADSCTMWPPLLRPERPGRGAARQETSPRP